MRSISHKDHSLVRLGYTRASVTTQTNVGIYRHFLLITLELVHQLAADEAEIWWQTDCSCCDMSQQLMVAFLSRLASLYLCIFCCYF